LTILLTFKSFISNENFFPYHTHNQQAEFSYDLKFVFICTVNIFFGFELTLSTITVKFNSV
jgi:hypothetical protein